MLTKSITDFTTKYNITFNELLDDFESGLSTTKLVELHGVKEHPLRKFMYSLGLDFAKSKRKASVLQLRQRLANVNETEGKLSRKLEAELNTTVDIINKTNRKLILARDENNLLRRQLRHAIRQESYQELMLDSFREIASTLSVITVEAINKPAPILDEGLCVVFSDEHFGELIDNDTLDNKYNYGIAVARLKAVVNAVVTSPMQSKTLNMFMLMDSLKGLIHGGAYTNEVGFTTAIMKLVEAYTSIIASLSKAYDKVIVSTTLDNHSRTTDHISTNNKEDNFSVMAFKMIEMLLKEKGINNVKFNFSRGNYNYVEINGAGCLLFHGDAVRTYRASSETSVSKMQDICLSTFKTPAKHFISGHKHTFEVKANQYGGMNIQNGTLVGSNEYGVNSGFLDIAAIQTVIFINENGNVSNILPVDVTHIK